MMRTVRFASHHAQKPSSAFAFYEPQDDPGNTCAFRAHTIFVRWPSRRIARATSRQIHLARSFTAPLNPRRPTVGAPFVT